MPLALLAHQGGWDEILLVAGPIVVFAGLLWVARRRAIAHAEATRGPQGSSRATRD